MDSCVSNWNRWSRRESSRIEVSVESFGRAALLEVCGGFFLPSPGQSNIGLVCVVADRDYQQGQGTSSSVPTHPVRGWGPAGRDPGGETGLEWGTGQEADVRGDLQTGGKRFARFLQRAKLSTLQFDHCGSSLSHCSSRALPKARRQTSSTPCCACWSSTPPTSRTWSGRGQRSWRWRGRRQTNWWLLCCQSKSMIMILTKVSLLEISRKWWRPGVLEESRLLRLKVAGLGKVTIGYIYLYSALPGA